MCSQQNLDVENTETADKRDPRRRVFKKAIASYSNQSISMEVLVRDFSDGGVRLKIKENDLLPNQFTLFIELDGVLVDCEVVWRRGLEIGAKFVSSLTSKQPTRSQVLESSNTNRKTSILKKTPQV